MIENILIAAYKFKKKDLSLQRKIFYILSQ